MLLMLEGFYVVCISLLEFGFGDCVGRCLDLMLKLLCCISSWLSTFPGGDIFLYLCSCRFFHWYWTVLLCFLMIDFTFGIQLWLFLRFSIKKLV